MPAAYFPSNNTTSDANIDQQATANTQRHRHRHRHRHRIILTAPHSLSKVSVYLVVIHYSVLYRIIELLEHMFLATDSGMQMLQQFISTKVIVFLCFRVLFLSLFALTEQQLRAHKHQNAALRILKCNA
uniref:Uncharacterized protein n=1 Tax=Glossina austeni TaxID=7395 RepID=A0A1A9VWX6_GLOAU